MLSCSVLARALLGSAALANGSRCASSAAPTFVNRNPRNLERLRVARKPDGHHLEKPGRCFWHKLVLTASNRLVRASVVHYLNGEVLSCSTSEWALRKQLYSSKDTSAYINLGRVFARRCLEAGLTEMRCDLQAGGGNKVDKFLAEVAAGGVRLQESDRYIKPNPWDQHRPEKPWEVHE